MNLLVCLYLSLFNMDIKPQNVLGYHGNNAIFMVWNFKNDIDVKDTFARICKLVINLNNSADARSPDSGELCNGDRI